uniref:uncharacterized protein LOC124065373 n=1 Tax=Scatophagus argus TaxID=75038 RepID=UPI001ED7F736|nr:uncharacterized protein LOC124065373 [Scatophagus argus]
MASLSSLSLCLLTLTHAAALQSSDHLMMFALPGDDVTLPCGIPSVKSCSSVSWSMAEQFGSVTVVARAGKVTAKDVRLGLLKDCSLQMHHLTLNDARLYSCDSGELTSSVQLQILQLTESSTPAEGTIELHCFLNTYKGHVPCNNTGIRIKWSTENNTPLKGDRFHFDNPSECFSKLVINKKLTDHHRKWTCRLFQNEMAKSSISYTTTVKDGIEEVFAVVGESASLSCGNTSSLSAGEAVKWAAAGRTLTDVTSPYKGQTEEFQVNKDTSLVISKVSALHAGDYECSQSTGQQKAFNKIRLHVLDVTSECGPEGHNLTLTCVLTCSNKCEKDFNLTWSGSNLNGWQSSLMNVNNTLSIRLFLPAVSVTSDDLTCSLLREGDVMASKTWHKLNPLWTPAWLALLLGLLICIAAGGLYMYMKRKHKKDAGSESGNEQSSIGMTVVYEVIQEGNNEDTQQQRQSKREAVTTTDSFYDLLQAVN